MSITRTEKKAPCRFEMFTRRKKECVALVRNPQDAFTFRGDKYDSNPDKMLKYLLGIIVNYKKQYAVMQMHDTTKPKDHPERIILKILNGQPVINRLPAYAPLLNGYALPEYLSYEIIN